MKQTLLGLGSCVSRALNVLRGGSPDMTLSAAAYAEDLPIRPWIDALFAVFGQPDHCERWFWHDVDLAIEIVETAARFKRNTSGVLAR
jgi:hypothetical protein